LERGDPRLSFKQFKNKIPFLEIFKNPSKHKLAPSKIHHKLWTHLKTKQNKNTYNKNKPWFEILE
jgi:hypothetical protein